MIVCTACGCCGAAKAVGLAKTCRGRRGANRRVLTRLAKGLHPATSATVGPLVLWAAP